MLARYLTTCKCRPEFVLKDCTHRLLAHHVRSTNRMILHASSTLLQPCALPQEQCSNAPTLKILLMSTSAYQGFQRALEQEAFLKDDWVSFTSRPWVRGPIDAFLDNQVLARAINKKGPTKNKVSDIIANFDLLISTEHLEYVVQLLKWVSSNDAVYTLLGVTESVMNEERISRLEHLSSRAMTEGRLEKLVNVLHFVLSEERTSRAFALLKKLATKESIDSVMERLEIQLEDEELLLLLDKAIENITAHATDDKLLSFWDTLDELVPEEFAELVIVAFFDVMNHARMENLSQILSMSNSRERVIKRKALAKSLWNLEAQEYLPEYLPAVDKLFSRERLVRFINFWTVLLRNCNSIDDRRCRLARYADALEGVLTQERVTRYLAATETALHPKTALRLLPMLRPLFMEDRLLRSLELIEGWVGCGADDDQLLDQLDEFMEPGNLKAVFEQLDLILTPQNCARAVHILVNLANQKTVEALDAGEYSQSSMDIPHVVDLPPAVGWLRPLPRPSWCPAHFLLRVATHIPRLVQERATMAMMAVLGTPQCAADVRGLLGDLVSGRSMSWHSLQEMGRLWWAFHVELLMLTHRMPYRAGQGVT